MHMSWGMLLIEYLTGVELCSRTVLGGYDFMDDHSILNYLSKVFFTLKHFEYFLFPLFTKWSMGSRDIPLHKLYVNFLKHTANNIVFLCSYWWQPGLSGIGLSLLSTICYTLEGLLFVPINLVSSSGIKIPPGEFDTFDKSTAGE